MLFVAEYEFEWDALETVIAKRLEWGELKPDTFRFLGEYVWPSGDPAFSGVAIVEAGSPQDLQAFVLHYGPSVSMWIHPATDVLSGIEALQPGKPRRRSRRA